MDEQEVLESPAQRCESGSDLSRCRFAHLGSVNFYLLYLITVSILSCDVNTTDVTVPLSDGVGDALSLCL